MQCFFIWIIGKQWKTIETKQLNKSQLSSNTISAQNNSSTFVTNVNDPLYLKWKKKSKYKNVKIYLNFGKLKWKKGEHIEETKIKVELINLISQLQSKEKQQASQASNQCKILRLYTAAVEYLFPAI
jgi:hypothetical protein